MFQVFFPDVEMFCHSHCQTHGQAAAWSSKDIRVLQGYKGNNGEPHGTRNEGGLTTAQGSSCVSRATDKESFNNIWT